MHDFGFGFWGPFGGIFSILFIAAFVIFVVYLVRRTGESSSESTQQTPLDIAGERYSLGEISKEEFDKIKKDLP
jgi:putative membrane protein